MKSKDTLVYLGCFPYTSTGEKLAAKKYDEAAIKNKITFANLNFKNKHKNKTHL